MEKLSDMPNIGAELALEGAIQGIRWHKPDTLKKQELLQFMRAVNRGDWGIKP